MAVSAAGCIGSMGIFMVMAATAMRRLAPVHAAPCLLRTRRLAQHRRRDADLIFTPSTANVLGRTRLYAFTLDEIERQIESPQPKSMRCASNSSATRLTTNKSPPPEDTGSILAADPRSWQRDEGSLYGRLDMSFDGRGPAKLLEYNADTPTSIFEAAVFQWTWLEQAIERHIVPPQPTSSIRSMNG